VEVDQVAAFLAITQHGGFTRASEVLHVSQPAISRRIALLEQELGVPLFDRVGRAVLLTEAGRAFLPHAQLLASVLQDGLAAVREVRDGRAGEVALAFVGTLANTALTEQLRWFRDAHPDVQIRLRTATSDGVSDLVRRGEAVLGLRYDVHEHPDLVSTPVLDEVLVPVVGANHPLARSGPVRAEQLAAHPWVTFPARPGEARHAYADALSRLLGPALRTAEVAPIDSLTAQMRMVEAGFGLALLPRSGVADALASGRLRTLDVAVRLSIPVVLVQRRAGFLSGAATALRRRLLEHSHAMGGRPDTEAP
jgi:DNA-binding transcriptional LysR family regulator